jgi:RimJ/RimL family protein N-acetyltransferase
MSVKLIYWLPEHAERLALIANNYSIAKYMRNRFPHPYHLNDANSFIEWIDANFKNLVFAIEVDGIVVGSIGIFPGDDIYCASAELGYWIAEEYWGRGIATEALTQMLNYVFSNFIFNKIRAHVFSNNPSSMRVLEKCGFYKEAVLYKSVYKFEEYLDEHLYTCMNPNIVYS